MIFYFYGIVIMYRVAHDRKNFPEYVELINFLLTKKIYRNIWHLASRQTISGYAHISYTGNMNPEVLIYRRSTRGFGSIEIIMRRFNPKHKYDERQEKNLFSVRFNSLGKGNLLASGINTSDLQKVISFVKEYYP